MFENDKFTLHVDNGEEIECEVFFVHTDESTGKNYVVYTDNIEDENGDIKIYSALLEYDENDEACIHPIETEEECEMMDNIIDMFLEEDEE